MSNKVPDQKSGKFKDHWMEEGNHMQAAQTFINVYHSKDGMMLLYYYDECFYTWRNTHYEIMKREILKALAWKFLKSGYTYIKDGCKTYVKPNKTMVSNFLEALQAECTRTQREAIPFWIHQQDAPKASEIISMQNGLLHLPSGNLLPHSPDFFNLSYLPFDYDPNAPVPVEWLKFLNSVWPNDPQSVETVQEIFGYVLFGDNHQQKIFMLVGPKRSGKGTIISVLEELIGQENSISVPTSAMGERFGLSPLIGKSLIVFADARLGNGREMNILVERLLNISGGDSLTIDRKNREAWTGRLPGRIVMASNEIPRLYDKAGALASRFIIIRMKFSAFGKEDVNLRQRLMNELPGIFNWAIEGLKRLQTRGKFVQPKTGVDALADLVALSSPISAFVRDRCIVVSGKTVTTTEIFAAWVKWCEETEYARPGNIQTFGRLLHSAVSGIETLQRRTPTTHERFFSGIGLIVSDE